MSASKLLIQILEDLSAAARRIDERLAVVDASLSRVQNDLAGLQQTLTALAPEEHADAIVVAEDDLPPLDSLPQLPADLPPSDPQDAVPNPDELAAMINELWKDA